MKAWRQPGERSLMGFVEWLGNSVEELFGFERAVVKIVFFNVTGYDREWNIVSSHHSIFVVFLSAEEACVYSIRISSSGTVARLGNGLLN
jgi:hypothetical protein